MTVLEEARRQANSLRFTEWGSDGLNAEADDAAEFIEQMARRLWVAERSQT